MTEPLLVQREIHIAAPPATVFALLTDPEKIIGWMGAEATIEAQPGGLYLATVTKNPSIYELGNPTLVFLLQCY
jgi:uncharacterized protein YndB with AHSA1/START domain